MKSLVVTLLIVSVLCALPPEIVAYRDDLMQHHPSLLAVDEKLKQNRFEQRLATRLPDPMIGATVALSPVETRIGPQRGVVSLSQTLLFPSFLKARKGTKALGEPLIETTKELEKAKLMAELLLHITSLQEITKRLSLYEEYQRLINMHIEVVESRYVTSSTARRAVISAELERIRNEDAILKLQKMYRDVQIAFNTLLGYAPEKKVTLPEEFLHLDTLTVGLLDSQSIDLALFDKKIALAKGKASVEQASLFPGITLGGKYIFNGESEMTPAPENSGKDAFQLFINAPIPLSRKKNRLRVSLYEQETMRLYAEKEALHRRLRKEMETLLVTLQEEDRKIVLSKRVILPKLRELQENSMELYSTGKLRFDELLLIERELVMEENMLLTAQVNHIKTQIKINKLLGVTYDTGK